MLLYQSDPAATLRRLAQSLKPCGIVVFHEVDFSFRQPTDPPVSLLDSFMQLVPEAFRRSGLPPDFGRRIAPAFVAADLPYPTVVAETPIFGPDSYASSWGAATLISLAARFDQLGLKMPDGFAADETLPGRLEALMRQHCTQLHGSVQYGAWTRKLLTACKPRFPTARQRLNYLAPETGDGLGKTAQRLRHLHLRGYLGMNQMRILLQSQ